MSPITLSRCLVGHSQKRRLVERFSGRTRMTLRRPIGGCDWCRQPVLRLGEETFDCERCLRCGALRYSEIQRR